LAIPVIVGQKSPGEKFPGAVTTYALEAMMQDGKALQMGTSHHLGQNFARSNQIRFSDPDGNLEYVHTTSWGVTTRMIGGVIMIHSDDNGLRLPPRIATKQIAILPILIKPEHNAQVMEAVKEVEQLLSQTMYADDRLRVTVDSRDLRGGEKKWEWIKKGIPLRLEIGPRDVEEGVVSVYRRDRAQNACERIPKADLSEYVQKTLAEIQQNYYEEALSNRNARFEESITDFEELKQYFAEENEESGQRGFVRAKWCGDPESEKRLEALKVSIRVLPLDQSSKPGKCVLTGKPGTIDVLIARSY
ncbi:MAG: proline--tRNA ligase, partial [Chlamydiia bacterium]|nr:proline--tRNA ligase [Chlamydiia bacterium]